MTIGPWRALAATSLLACAAGACDRGASSATAGSTPPATSEAASTKAPTMNDKKIHDLEVETLAGEKVALSTYKGKTLLVVNTASKCGYTPQLGKLQQLQAKYGEKGFTVLGFPSNDFGGQEPGTADEIKSFASDEYGVEFPLFAKSHAKGDGLAPVFEVLTSSEAGQGPIQWNFTKFLVGPDGTVLARFDSRVDPLDTKVTGAIEKSLGG